MAPTDSHENRMRGISWMLATMFCFISLDSIMKHLLENYSLVQVTWGRFFFGTVFAAVMCGRNLLPLLKSHAPKKQLLRSILLMSTTGMFNAGIRTTPLATGTTIMFMSPILVTLLSIPLLGEKVGIRRWSGIVLGFTGAIIVVQPWKNGLTGVGVGILFLLIAALLNANYQIVTRMVRNDDPLTSLLFTATAGAIVTSCLVPWFWTWPTAQGWGLLVGSGLFGGLGHFCLIRALRLAPASVVAPFSYSALIWATLFGFVIWSDWPDFWTWVGAAIIIGSGLYIFHRERRRNTTAIET
jgi:drug/metabolite transporter (DMT)-like permease